MTFWHKLAYSFGNFANTVCYQSFSNRIKFFYISVLHVPAAWVGAVWFLFGFWNAVNDPLMGQISDRTRTRWGRRIPFILFGAVPLGLTFFFLWTPPVDDRRIWTTAYFLVAVFVFDTLYSLLTLAYNSLFPEIVRTSKERSELSALREATALVGLILAVAMAPWLSSTIGYPRMGLVVAAATSGGYLLSVLGSKENVAALKEEETGLLESARIALRSIPFRWFLTANLFKEFVWLMLSATMPFYAKYVLKDEGSQAALLGLPFISAAPFLPLWAWLTPRWGARTTLLLSLLLFIPGLAWLGVADSATQALIGTGLLAPGLAGTMMLPHVLIAEIIDDDARKTGERREGIFFGINGAAVKLAFSLEGLLFATVLPLSGFISGSHDGQVQEVVQPGSAVVGIRFLMAAAPAVGAVIAATALALLPLEDREAPPPEPSSLPTEMANA